jgi:hypothetical protein
MGGGLKVEYAFSREDGGGYASQTVCRLLLSLTNMRDTPIRRVKVVNADARVLPFEEVSSIEPGATVEVRLGVDFKVMGPSFHTSPPLGRNVFTQREAEIAVTWNRTALTQREADVCKCIQ